MLKSNSDYTAFDGWKVTGWPVVTIRRGEIVFRGGKILGVPGSGQVVKRAATKKL
jgi:dihydropyrimidinase